MLYFVSRDLALGYLLFSFLSALGVLQWVAARQRLTGLGLFDYSKHPGLGTTLGLVLPAVALVWFMASQWEGIFAPGPAGSEISLLFGAAAVAAVLVSLVCATARRFWARSDTETPEARDCEVVDVRHFTGHLYVPSVSHGKLAVVCILPMPKWCWSHRARLARRLTQAGLAALVMAPDHESFVFPDVLALMPAAVAFLRDRPGLDADRVGVLGYGIAGDLAIRVGGCDKQIRAVVALAPVMSDMPVGLDLLTELSYGEAWRWVHDRKRMQLREDLDARHYAPKIAPRPLLLVYGAEDRLVGRAPVAEWDGKEKGWVGHQVIDGAGHLDLMADPVCIRSIVEWLRERL